MTSHEHASLPILLRLFLLQLVFWTCWNAGIAPVNAAPQTGTTAIPADMVQHAPELISVLKTLSAADRKQVLGLWRDTGSNPELRQKLVASLREWSNQKKTKWSDSMNGAIFGLAGIAFGACMLPGGIVPALTLGTTVGVVGSVAGVLLVNWVESGAKRDVAEAALTRSLTEIKTTLHPTASRHLFRAAAPHPTESVAAPASQPGPAATGDLDDSDLRNSVQ